ncbi:MAG: cytochrome c biogenesis protein CcsA [Candidatus Caldipriscus sp.]|nr:cytochrome c biogenesis protein CcsA [Candidatus Caldipriscus sp.]
MLFFALVLVALTQIYALFFIPPVKWFGPKGEELGIVQKIFYVHVPSAWVGFLGIIISAIFGIIYLYRRENRYDKLSHSFMEVSLVFITVGLFTGSLWAKPAWGTFWTWDPRLVSMAILWMLALGYLFFRSLVEEEELRAKFSAILSIITAINIPIVFLSIRLFKTLHPAVLKGLSTSETYGMDPEISLGLLLNLLSVSILMFSLSLKRYKKT